MPPRSALHLRLRLIAPLALALLTGACVLVTDLDEVERPPELPTLCADDEDCDNGIFCDGAERCEPTSAGSDPFGCVSGDPAALLDDGVACTEDRCDEGQNRVQHDLAPCVCVNDAECVQLNTDPCQRAACDVEAGQCRTTPLQPGDACDDGLSCTTGTTCDAELRCLPGAPGAEPDPCDDGLFCNGAERCEPSHPRANTTTGCAPGARPEDAADQDDGIACTITRCDEDADRIFHDPRSCMCETPEDCARTLRACHAWSCDASTSFTCAPREEVPAPADTPCDDGIACTGLDACNAEGVCVGQPVQALCADRCEDPDSARCAPGDLDADAATGCRCGP